MEQGEIFTAEIEDMNTLGNGIAKSDGCVIFCYGAADGDRVTAQIRDKKKNFMTADVVSTDAPSPYRCAPDCKAFGVCGGCALKSRRAPVRVNAPAWSPTNGRAMTRPTSSSPVSSSRAIWQSRYSSSSGTIASFAAIWKTLSAEV